METDKEVNETIAAFMGIKIKYSQPTECDGCEDKYFMTESLNSNFYTPNCRVYTESLDALIPVWAKLKLRPDFSTTIDGKYEVAWLKRDTDFMCSGVTMQEAASYATAKAIKILNRM